MAAERGNFSRQISSGDYLPNPRSMGGKYVIHEPIHDMSAIDTISSSPQVQIHEITPILTPVIPDSKETEAYNSVDFISDRSFQEEMKDISPYLLDGEKVKLLHRINIPKPLRKLSAEEVLLKLGNVQTPQELGIHPFVAATPAEGSESIEEFKRFIVPFGRDQEVEEAFLESVYPQITLRLAIYLSEKQGVKTDWQSEEEPGKTPHEIRSPFDQIAKQIYAEKGWKFPYSGTIDATPLYIRTVMRAEKKQPGSLQTPINDGNRVIEDTLLAAKDYLISKQDSGLTNLIEHKRLNPKGIENQNWKDSKDSLSHKDGSLPDPDSPKAFLEVQVYTFDAFLDMAEYYTKKDPELAADLTRRASILKDQILERFWIVDEKGGYFVPALERVKDDNGKDVLKPFEIRTSNMGHTLWSRLLKGNNPDIIAKREAVLKTLHSPDMRNISGFRTLSASEVRFKPTAYHNGNVWFWDSLWIALGEKELGYEALARQDMFDIYRAVDTSGMMPEFGKGNFSLIPELNEREVEIEIEGEEELNKIEQVPQQEQLWTAAAMRRIEEEMKNWKTDVAATPIERECLDMMRNGMIFESSEQSFAAD